MEAKEKEAIEYIKKKREEYQSKQIYCLDHNFNLEAKLFEKLYEDASNTYFYLLNLFDS